VLLVGQNPAQPKTSAARDQPYMEARRALGHESKLEALARFDATVRSYVKHWPIMQGHFPLEECRLALDDIAFCNVVRYRTDRDTPPGPRVFGACVATHFDHWLTRLAPRVVSFIGRRAADRGIASCTRLLTPAHPVHLGEPPAEPLDRGAPPQSN